MIVIIALESQFYFNLALNLAKSIKRHHRNLPIALLSDKFTDPVFDQVIKPDFTHHTENRKFNPFRLKTYIYDYSPFEKTLYLDADNLCIKPIGDLLKKLEETDFLIHEVKRWDKTNRERCKMVWTDKVGHKLVDLTNAYNIPEDNIYPEYNSSFIWFTKSEKNKKYFDLAKALYMDRRIKYKDIGTCYPDELAWGLASTILKQYSGVEHFKPIYHKWEASKKGGTDDINLIKERYWFLGMAGGLHAPGLLYLYKRLSGMTFHNRKKIFHVR